jgi:hypothetical protein
MLKGSLVLAGDFAKLERMRFEATRRDAFVESAIARISPGLAVLHGPFAGMLYPERKADCSSLFPKILGSYESELHPFLEETCRKEHRVVVDVGCAEGCYAVGLARRLPGARVHAFDLDGEAIRLCGEMAHLNGVLDRVTTGASCGPETLRSLCRSGKALIVSDCEGYEKDLFTEEVVPSLAGHDLLIEVHDCLDIEISGTLRRRSSATHSIRAVQSLDDIVKAHTYSHAELGPYDLATRNLLLAEHRASIMEWLYLTPLAS